MDLNLKRKIMRRKENIYEFYYKNIGDKIRKTRIESNLTQEDLARGICSNTYISKIENNKIAINKENLNLIMEKMDMSSSKIGIPEQMVDYLRKSFKYFFFKDLESYKKLFDYLKDYEFGVLVSVIRLGYYVLNEEFENAKTIYNDLFRYLNSLEDYGFSIFVIYGSFYNIGINDYQSARILLASVNEYLENNEKVLAMYYYSRFIVYGNLCQFSICREGLDLARLIFVKYSNCARIIEFAMYNNIFKVYENSNNNIYLNKNFLQGLTPNQKNYYLLILSETDTDSTYYLDKLDENGDYYLFGLFKKAQIYYKKKMISEYNQLKQKINVLHYQKRSKIDYYNILKLIESNQIIYLKDYLINYVLPYITRKQNLFYYQNIIMVISDILKSKKRYKDALIYYMKYFSLKKKLQFE